MGVALHSSQVPGGNEFIITTWDSVNRDSIYLRYVDIVVNVSS